MAARLWVVTCLLWGPCKSGGDLRGHQEPTSDAGTLLSIDDDNGGGCQLWLDGRKVSAKTPLSVTPGTHWVDCGDRFDKAAANAVHVRRGHHYHFDYWGP